MSAALSNDVGDHVSDFGGLCVDVQINVKL